MDNKEHTILWEVFTGRQRPRHLRFSKSLAKMLGQNKVLVYGHKPGKLNRLKMVVGSKLRGFRGFTLNNKAVPCILHQAINLDETPYITEFDVPLGVHSYNIKHHRRSSNEARRLMEKDSLRAILVFSQWAKRSFELHYGQLVGSKCHVVYPLASDYAMDLPYNSRYYDFCFISTQFRIKCGPELVNAFEKLQSHFDHEIKLCIVTDLEEARNLLGNLDTYKGIEWRNAKLSEIEVAQLLASSRCLVHPSLAESFGVVVLEALASGCAIIASNIASFPEMVRDNDNGFLIAAPISTVVGDAFITEYGNASYFADYMNTLSLHLIVDELVRVMSLIVMDTEKTKEMMRQSADLFRDRFSETTWMKCMRDILICSFPDFKCSRVVSELLFDNGI